MILRLIVNAIRRALHPKLTESEIDDAIGRLAKEYANKRGGERLNWRESLVDLLKVLEIDPSFDHRNHLWGELGFRDKYEGSEQQNTTMIQEVRRRFANGELD